MKNRHVLIVSIFFTVTSTAASAFDWTQPILDENEKTIPDCQGKETCDKVLTIGTLTGRALLAPLDMRDPGTAHERPEQKSISGDLGLQIIKHPDLSLNPDELKLACDAIGSVPSRLAVARGWALLGCQKAVK